MSLGMSFARRRIMAAARKEPKYVWAVYNCGYGKDESSATTGSFSATGTRTKMASSVYTASNSGFTLTNPTSTQLKNLVVGQYLVNVSTSSNSSTTGTYLYEITGKSGSSNVTIQYKRYLVGFAKSGAELYQVSSDTKDYPVDGEKNGLWYVMIKGDYTVYVWNQYNSAKGYVAVEKSPGTTFHDVQTYVYSGSSYTLDQSTGKFTIKNATKTQVPAFSSSNYGWSNALIPAIRSKWWATNTGGSNNPTFSTLYYGYTGSEDNAAAQLSVITTEKYVTATSQNINSNVATGVTKESQNSGEYPNNGYSESDGFWYVYSHSYVVEFDNR